MGMEAPQGRARLSPFEQLRYARQILQIESQAVAKLSGRLDSEFCRAVDLVYHCQGSVIVSGMGKAGLVGQKIMATLASTGTRSHCLHPAEAVHGDLGRIHGDDVALILSQSGETDEILRLLGPLAEMAVPIIAITGRAQSSLGQAATVTIEMGPLQEACPLGLAPSTSTTAMLALGDALALVVSQMRSFGREDFARFHPAGNLGRKLSKVEHYMRPLEHCRIAAQEQTIREVLVQVSRPGRRTGAVMLVDEQGKLVGLFTDSDLARLFEHRRDGELDRPVQNVMTRNPCAIGSGSMMADAVSILAERKISELPVVNTEGLPVGLIDITDVVSLLPQDSQFAEASQASDSGRVGIPAPHGYRVVHEPDTGGPT